MRPGIAPRACLPLPLEIANRSPGQSFSASQSTHAADSFLRPRRRLGPRDGCTDARYRCWTRALDQAWWG
jgi:hypothetical protein